MSGCLNSLCLYTLELITLHFFSKYKCMCSKAEAIWDANRYLREESPCWAAGSTASKECWLDREELWLVSTDLERSNELRYQRSACWSLIACGTNRTLFTRPSHLKNRINIKRVTNTQITEEFMKARFGTLFKQHFVLFIHDSNQ